MSYAHVPVGDQDWEGTVGQLGEGPLIRNIPEDHWHENYLVAKLLETSRQVPEITFMEVSVSIEDIDFVHLEKKLFRSRLTIQGRRMQTFRDVPKNQSGKIQLWFDRETRGAAEELAANLAPHPDQ